MSDGTALAGPDGALRCPWALSTADYVTYHDEEWGRPVHGDEALFERLSLEAFQSGLSWITILRRRYAASEPPSPTSRSTRSPPSPTRTATASSPTPQIIRNRAKIDATLANARVLVEAGHRANSTN